MESSRFAPAILRYGLTAVFLFFSISQLTSPSDWTGFIPSYVPKILDPVTLIYANAIFELVFCILLAVGLMRLSAFLLSIHLFAITFSIGFDPTGARDSGLAVSMLAIAFFGPDMLCLDKKLKDAKGLAKFRMLMQ